MFQVNAGAPANSVKVSSTGRVGFRTATPVLDLHMNTSDTQAVRFEQNSSGGFSAQTWDIAANEANFFVRDVTSGSRLPFRVRPGAPTSSIDINASGNVGVGTASPGTYFSIAAKLDASTTSRTLANVNAGTAFTSSIGFSESGSAKWLVSSRNTFDAPNNRLGIFNSGGTEVATFTSAGNVGIGTNAPDQKFSVNGDASKSGGGSWQTFSDGRLKNINGRFNSGLKAVMQLQPIRYQYKPENPLGLKSEGEHIGFAAQAVQKIIPEAVTKNSDGYLMVNNNPILWTMLNAIKEQQKEIAELKGQVRKLQATSRRRRK